MKHQSCCPALKLTVESSVDIIFKVDFMLGSYMEDIGITPAQFEEACGKGTGKVKKQFHHGLFEQVHGINF